MIELLTTAALAGLSFQCEADTAYLTVFAPAQEVTADYRVASAPRSDGFGDYA